MSAAARLVTAYAEAYARHVGRPQEGIAEEVARRLALMEPWARAYAAASAWLVLRVAPLLFLYKAASFESLAPEERERLLGRLVDCPPAARGLFLGARSLALTACYGRRRP